MDIRFQSVDFKASDHLKSLVEEKTRKLFDLDTSITHADVKMFKDGGEPAVYVCEIRLGMPGNDPFVKKSGPSYEHALADCVASMQNILRQ